MKSIICFTFIALMGISFSSGCRKKKATTAKIIVRDAASELVLGASVNVYGDPSVSGKVSVVNATQPSDYKGEAYFNYDDIYQLGQAGVAVLNIKVTKGSLIGTGMIKIEAEVENAETVFIQ